MPEFLASQVGFTQLTHRTSCCPWSHSALGNCTGRKKKEIILLPEAINEITSLEYENPAVLRKFNWSRDWGTLGSAPAGPGTHLVTDTTSFLTENTEGKLCPQRIIAVQTLTVCVTLTPSHSRSHLPVRNKTVRAHSPGQPCCLLHNLFKESFPSKYIK